MPYGFNEDKSKYDLNKLISDFIISRTFTKNNTTNSASKPTKLSVEVLFIKA